MSVITIRCSRKYGPISWKHLIVQIFGGISNRSVLLVLHVFVLSEAMMMYSTVIRCESASIACSWLFNCPSQPQNKAVRQMMFSRSSSGRNLLFHHCSKEQQSACVGHIKEGRFVSLGFAHFCSMKLLSPAISVRPAHIKQRELLFAELTSPTPASAACSGPSTSPSCLQKQGVRYRVLHVTVCYCCLGGKSQVHSNLNCATLLSREISPPL